MSQHNFAKITTDGLVFIYDADNIKSYKGPPTQNIITSRNPLNGSGTGYSFVGTTEYINVPGLGLTNCARVDIINNYSAVSTWCCPNVMQFGGGYSVSPSTTYTYGIVYKCDSGYTNANYMYRYEYNGGTYVLEQGVHSTGNRVHLGSGWYYAWGVFTTAATTNLLQGLASFYYNYPTLYDTYRVAKIMLIQGNYAGLHPKYWPDPGTTRSNTQALLDIKKNTTITASSLTYNANGTFSFNGSNRLNLTMSGSSTLSQYTRIVWIKPTATSGDMKSAMLNQIGNNSDMAVGIEAGYPSFHQYTKTGTSGTTDGDWTLRGSTLTTVNNIYMVAVTVDRLSGTNNIKVYLNGILDGIGSRTLGVAASNNVIFGGPASDDYAGSRMFYGDIYAASQYNKILSATEILNNFNAHKSRYGL